MKIINPYLLVTSILLLINTKGNAQLLFDAGDIFDEIVNTDIAAIPAGDSSNLYVDPNMAQLNKWDEVLVHLFAGEYAAAATDANSIDYDLIEFTDGVDMFYILRNNMTNYWGTYVYNPNFCRPLITQAPHPKNDFNTGKEAIHVFKETEAMFFCMAGTHRCNNASPSSCSGQTKVCNAGLNTNNEDYRISDMAHTATSIFQATTEKIFTTYNNTYFISLHGFTKKNTDPYVILSNGTNQTPTTDYIVPFADELDNIDASLTFKIAHVDNWTRLVGFSNTQGRLINSSPNNICTGNNAPTTTGRFIHMEQEKSKLRADQTGWDKVANALIATIPCMALPVEYLTPFTVKITADKQIQCTWTTRFEEKNDYFEVEKSTNSIDWKTVANTEGTGHSQQNLSYTIIDSSPFQGLSYYRLRQVDWDGNYRFSSIHQVYLFKSKLKIYPNPADETIKIEGFSVKNGYFNIYNSLHQTFRHLVKKSTFYGTSIEIDISRLSSGLYFFIHNGDVVKFYKK